MNNKRMIVAAGWIVLGVVLTVCNFMGAVDEYWSGMGASLIVVGALQLFRQIKYKTNSEYRESVDVGVKDERNKFISMKAWAWAGYFFVLIAAVASIALRIGGRDELSVMASCGACLIMVLYWLSWLWLRKKY